MATTNAQSNAGLDKWRVDVATALKKHSRAIKKINKTVSSQDETDPVATIIPSDARSILDEVLSAELPTLDE